MDPQSPELEPESYDSALISAVQASRGALALPAAAGAALLGALIWAAISHFANFEIGWIAWGIGAGAGAACAALGGRTQVHAILCAAIALAGIAGGKALAVHFDRLKIEREFFSDEALRPGFEERLEDARLWCELGEDPSFEQVRSYLIQRDYVDEGEVPPRDVIDDFEREEGPRLVSDHRTPLTFAAFRERIGSNFGAVLSFSEHFRATLSPFDLLWVLLGLSSAFGIVQNAGKQEQAAAQEARQAERRARRRPVPPS